MKPIQICNIMSQKLCIIRTILIELVDYCRIQYNAQKLYTKQFVEKTMHNYAHTVLVNIKPIQIYFLHNYKITQNI